MFITRKAEFSASHYCYSDKLSEQQNQALYGDAARRNGHGHNYIIEVTVEGDPDPVTGMIMDLKVLKDILEEEIVTPMDHRFLNYEVEPFDQIVPTAENIAASIWGRLDARLQNITAKLYKVRLYETADLYVDITRDEEGKVRG